MKREPGSKDPTHAKNAVSGFHNKALGMDVLPQDDPDGTSHRHFAEFTP
jgi:hypothetical protein